MNRLLNYMFLVALMPLIFSCEKMVEVNPPRSQFSRASVFENELTAKAATLRLYTRLSTDNFLNTTYLASLSADELKVSDGDAQLQFYHNSVLSINPNIEASWRYHYTTIYNANSIIEGLQQSTQLDPDRKEQLMGEAKFVRAFCHFNLVNLFGDVPYITTTDFEQNGLVRRMPVAEVYQNILNDLIEAKSVLPNDYAFSENERVRANKWAAGALMARVYLYQRDWLKAENYATEIIERTSLYELAPRVDQVFLKNSKEGIFQLIPPYPQKYTVDGGWLLKDFFGAGNATITEDLYSAFEPNDERFEQWIGTGTLGANTWHYALKYKENSENASGAEYSMVFRLAELYLIRAEARANQNLLSAAADDVNELRERAGLLPINPLTKDELLAMIEQERRVELFTEGHRWFDLKRSGRTIEVLGSTKPGIQSTDLVYPLPYSEIKLNPNLTQNPSY